MDVARKLIILGREMGLTLELQTCRWRSLVPAELAEPRFEEFMAQLPRYDTAIAARLSAASARGKVLRYTGTLSASGQATVGLKELDARHAFANIALTDNVCASRRALLRQPLIVQAQGGRRSPPRGVRRSAATGAYLGARL